MIYTGRMRFSLLLCALVACGGGGSAPATAPADQSQTVRQAFEECLTADAVDLASLVDLLQGLLDSGQAGVPQPEFNLIAAILGGGVVPYTWDLDADGANELAGSVRFLDLDGNTTIPFDLADLLASGVDDPLDLISQVPDGTRLELTFTLGGALLRSASEASGDGTLVFSLGGGFPAADFGFEARIGEDQLTGTIEFDGTQTAVVSAKLNDEPAETFEIDLAVP